MTDRFNTSLMTVDEARDKKAVKLSGSAYVAAVNMQDVDKRPASRYRYRIPIGARDNCNHHDQICASQECVKYWQERGVKLLFHRTGGGRALANELEIDWRFSVHSQPRRENREVQMYPSSISRDSVIGGFVRMIAEEGGDLPPYGVLKDMTDEVMGRLDNAANELMQLVFLDFQEGQFDQD